MATLATSNNRTMDYSSPLRSQSWPLTLERTTKSAARPRRRSRVVVLVVGMVLLLVASSLSFQIKSLDFVAYIKVAINEDVLVASMSGANHSTMDPSVPSSVEPSVERTRTRIITVVANETALIETTPASLTTSRPTASPTSRPTASPTSSPVTLTPTTTEHLVKQWPHWKASLAVKRQAAATSVNPRHVKTQRTTMFPAPDAPSQLLIVPIPSVHDRLVDNTTRTNYQAPKNTTKPILAILTSTFSKGKSHLPVEESLLVKHLLPSIVRTIAEEERHAWHVHVYIAVDDTDEWWLQNWPHMAVALGDVINDSWLNVTVGVFPTRPGNIPFNEIALVAYQHGADYFCRVNDDTEFTSLGWMTTAVATLRDMVPPNVGVVAPTCGQGNTDIMTHDFVHRTHLDIFYPHYYPPCFDNWYLDDWISSVYHTRVVGPQWDGHSQLLASWQVKHWTFESRYSARVLHAQWLPWEYERSLSLMTAYLNASSHESTVATPEASIAPSLPRPRYMDPLLVQRVLEVLPPDGNLLVWGFNGDSPFWHLSTSGAVVFWAEASLHGLWFKYHPYVLFENAVFETSVRGSMEGNAELFAHGQNLTDNAWCNLVLTVPESIRDTVWDVILVQAPMECAAADHCDDANGPGVYQPLFNSQLIAALQRDRNPHHVTHVLVHHYERAYEQDFAQRVFGARPHNVTVATTTQVDTNVTVTTELAHFVVDNTSPIRPLDTTKACLPVMAFNDSPNLVRWTYPTKEAVAASSLVQSPDTWIIFLELNDGHYEFLVNWLHHFIPLDIRIPVVIVADDDVVYDKITRHIVPHFNVTLERSAHKGTDVTALNYGTKDFTDLVAIRPPHIRDKLVQGWNVIYTDVDTVWRSNPLPYLTAVGTGEADVAMLVTASHKDGYSPYYSTGFWAMVSNNRTIDLANAWADMPKADFNYFLFPRPIKHQPLHWQEFPHGGLFFDQYNDASRNQTVLVHNDYIVGFAPKKERFQKVGLWNNATIS